MYKIYYFLYIIILKESSNPISHVQELVDVVFCTWDDFNNLSRNGNVNDIGLEPTAKSQSYYNNR
jgi:hypothetical protein